MSYILGLTNELRFCYVQLLTNLLEHLRKQKGTYVLWATSAVIGGVWLTDWKVILGYVPWINGKFKEDE
uniref:Cytochrome b-c1 complex subunit 10 n=1 Tax=Pseudonaja textilis TaxID=8673 RepID=A0A670Z137_PSETE